MAVAEFERARCVSEFKFHPTTEAAASDHGVRTQDVPCRTIAGSSRLHGRAEETDRDRQPHAGSMRGRKQKAGDERKVIDEEAEFRLVPAPMRWTMKRKSEEQHVNRREERGFSEESPGQQANGQRQLEQRSQPRKKLWNREAGGRDIGRRAIDIHHLE